MAAHAHRAWEASLDLQLVARLARPLRRPGLVSLAIVRRIHGGIDALFGRLSLLGRFAHKVRELAAPETPIVHARGAGATISAAPVGELTAPPSEASAPPTPLPIVRATERTIERTMIVEKLNRAEPSQPLGSGSIHETSRALDAGRESTPAHQRVEVAGARDMMATAVVGETRETRETRASREPSPMRESSEPSEPRGLIERTAPRVRRSRMGAPIMPRAAEPPEPPVVSARVERRTTEPADSPALVARVVPAAREVAAASAPAPGDAAVGAPTRLQRTPSAVVRPASAPDPWAPIVRPHRAHLSPSRSAGAPGGRSVDRAEVAVARRSAAVSPDVAAVVRPIAPPAPAAPMAASPAAPAVLPRARGARSEREQPLAHAAPRVQGSAPEPTPAVPLTGTRAPHPLPVMHRDPVAPPPPPAPKLELHELADHVQHILARREQQERERRGLPR